MGASTPRRPPRGPRRPPRGPRRPPRGPRRPPVSGSGISSIADAVFDKKFGIDKSSGGIGPRRDPYTPGEGRGGDGGKKFSEFLALMNRDRGRRRGGRRRNRTLRGVRRRR